MTMWNGMEISHEKFVFLDFQKSAPRGFPKSKVRTLKNEHKRSRANFPTVKANFLVLLKCAVQLPEDRSLTEKRQRSNIWNQLVREFIAIYSCKEYYAKERTRS